METADKIVEKVSELFLKYGIKSVTMDDIAAHLGMSKKTIYKFFENKTALVEYFIVNEIAINRNNFNLLVSTNNDPLVKLFFAMVNVEKFYLKLNPSTIYALERYYHQPYVLLKQHKDEFLFKAIKNSIEEGILLRLYQNDFNVDVMSGFFLESLTIVPGSGFFPSKKIDVTDQEDIIGHMISGIATPDGLDKINRYKSQHRLPSFAQILKQPYWED
jgi:TetR/AcrR family transcriptional regulator, cholesterol catabolism regulator